MGIIQDVKDLFDIVNKIDNIELIQKVSKLQSDLSRVMEELNEKNGTITKLKEALELKGDLHCEHSAYWKKDNEGNIVDGPFCTNCFDNDHIHVRLVHSEKPIGQAGHSWEWVQCPQCNVSFRQKNIGIYLNTH